jgi:hypothetical protein
LVIVNIPRRRNLSLPRACLSAERHSMREYRLVKFVETAPCMPSGVVVAIPVQNRFAATSFLVHFD